jgi:hypothetical protein
VRGCLTRSLDLIMEPTALPDDWGKDPVSEFLHFAQHNTVASFAGLRHEFELLRVADEIFRTLLANLNNSPQWFAGLFVLGILGSLSTGTFRSGIRDLYPASISPRERSLRVLCRPERGRRRGLVAPPRR